MCNTAPEMYIRFSYLGPLEQIQSREYGGEVHPGRTPWALRLYVFFRISRHIWLRILVMNKSSHTCCSIRKGFIKRY